MRHGSNIDPPNRFHSIHTESDFEQLSEEDPHHANHLRRPVEYLPDDSQSIVSKNNSPDISFQYSLNPYRGCVHACSYCYARPTHEYLGLNAGLDFETKIIVKKEAANLLRTFLMRKTWEPAPIVFSGVTDCYQPAEREFQLTRQCLQVAAEFQQPIGIITKNALVTRDIDLLGPLATKGLAKVFLSINSLDAELARKMEPRTSTPLARLRAMEELTAAGIPVGVMVAPMIPGLNDDQIRPVLEAAKKAGATAANYTLLRLPLTVEPVFVEWLERTFPDAAEKILGRIEQTREGKLNRSEFNQRMFGSGVVAQQIRALFNALSKKLELPRRLPSLETKHFQRPSNDGQMQLF